MKSIIVLTFTAIMLLMLTQSCQKETADVTMRTDDLQKTELTEMDKYLLDFRERMTNPLKSEEMFELEDARWHLSAMLNFAYANANPHYKLFKVDTFYTVFPLSNMTVSMEDIHDAFATFTIDLVDAFQAIPHDDKTLIVVATEVVDYNANEAEIRMVSTMGYDPSSTVFHFDSTDWWYWGVMGHYGYGPGKCGPYEGQEIGKDAATQLTYKANISIAVPIGRIYYTDEVQIMIYAHEDEIPVAQHPFGRRGAMMYFEYQVQGEPPLEWACLCPDEMNYYLYNIKNILAPNNIPEEGMVLSHYFIDPSIVPGGYLDRWEHIATLTYGFQHVSVIYPEPPFYTD